MKAHKDLKTGKWLIKYHYKYWLGNRKKSTKQGFSTKQEAEEWLRNFLAVREASLDMLFEDFLKIYYHDMESLIRETTKQNKRYIIELKVLPYFGKHKQWIHLRRQRICFYLHPLTAKMQSAKTLI